MRALFVSQELPPETGWGGIGTYVDVLSEALASRGVDVHVLSVVEDQAPSTTERRGVMVHRQPLPVVRGSGHVPRDAWARVWLPIMVALLIRRLGLRPTVVECPEWKAEGLVVALRRSFPLVVRLHSSARQLFPYTGQGKALRGLEGRLAARLEEASVRRANVVVSTKSNLDEVAGPLGLNQRAIHAIPYPVRLPDPSPLPTNGAARVTFVGRLEPRKAPDIVLRAAPKVLAAAPDTRFVFVGRDSGAPGSQPTSGWLRAEAVRLGIADAVELVGQLDPDGVLDEIRRATVCAFPSRWESFGNVVAEAGAVGRPVVVSSIPPFRELVDDRATGRIVPSEDADAWAAALLDVLSSRERAQAMGRAASEHVARISDPARVADLALTAHEHAIERWRRGERAGCV